MTNMQKITFQSKILPALRARGVTTTMLWLANNPPHPPTPTVAEHGVVRVNDTLVYFQNFTGNNGFDYFVQTKETQLDRCIDELIKLAVASSTEPAS